MASLVIPDLPTPEPAPPVASPLPKWWGHSLTIWGTLITAMSTVVPVLAPALGLDITPDLIRQLGDGVLLLAQALAGLAGTVMAIWGRIRAAGPVARRQIVLTM